MSPKKKTISIRNMESEPTVNFHGTCGMSFQGVTKKEQSSSSTWRRNQSTNPGIPFVSKLLQEWGIRRMSGKKTFMRREKANLWNPPKVGEISTLYAYIYIYIYMFIYLYKHIYVQIYHIHEIHEKLIMSRQLRMVSVFFAYPQTPPKSTWDTHSPSVNQ